MAGTIPMPDAKASTCAKALTHHWIVRFGVPQIQKLGKGRLEVHDFQR